MCNTRSVKNGDEIDPKANARVKLTLKVPGDLECAKCSADVVWAESTDRKNYSIDVPAAGFVIFEYETNGFYYFFLCGTCLYQEGFYV